MRATIQFNNAVSITDFSCREQETARLHLHENGDGSRHFMGLVFGGGCGF